MQVTQSIQKPLGINVFGSAIIRVSPNIATLNFSVGHVADHPRESFRVTRENAQRVREFLSNARVDEVSASRISLEAAYQYTGGENRFLGYRATVQFNVLLKRLDDIEAIITGLVDAGTNRISGISYETTELKSLRAEARRRAVRAAREKAQLYCDEANVILGPIVHLEDVNPDQLRGHESHAMREAVIDDEGPARAFDPGSIVVNGAVMVTFEIAQPKTD